MGKRRDPAKTIERILNESINLFLKKGYEETTIQDIVDGLEDLSKGAIYHHFKSKAEIIDEITERMFSEKEILEEVETDSRLNGLEKIEKLLAISVFTDEKSKKDEMMFSLKDPLKNPKFTIRFLENTVKSVPIVLERLILEGIDDGSINAKHPKEAAELIALLINFWMNAGFYAMSKDEFLTKALFFSDILKSLGVPILNEDLIYGWMEAQISLFK